ncbi:RGS-containing protein kinase RCK1 [Balamuthia mandrillaris]
MASVAAAAGLLLGGGSSSSCGGGGPSCGSSSTAAGAVGGGGGRAAPSLPFDNLIVDQEAAKDVQCGICLQILNKPRQCRNGHLFCLSCIVRSISKNPECPTCRCRLEEEHLARSLFVEKHIRNLKVFCKYHFKLRDEGQSFMEWIEDEDGCQEVLTLENRVSHEQKCGFAAVSCKYDSSCGRQRRKFIDQHEASCPFRPIQCDFCTKSVQHCHAEEHLAACPLVPIECKGCGLQIKRGELDSHLNKECPEEEVPCEFGSEGCSTRVLRKHLKQHLSEDIAYHMALLKRTFDSKTQQLTDQFEAILKLKDEKIKQLERAHKSSETKVIWKIKNFSSVRKKSYLQSDKFSFADFNWFIGFYTDGDNEESRGYFSIYLFLDVNHVPKGKSVTIEYFLTFLNHRDPNDNVKKEFKTTFPIKGGQGWGDRKAVLASKITADNGFLKQDTLYVEAEISIKKLIWAV